MGRNSYNIVSIVFLVLSLLWVGFVVVRLLGPAPVAQVAAVPTEVVIPTETPSNTPRPTLPATFTPTPTETNTPTITPTGTNTPAPTSTITDTPGPTLTPSATFTPSISPTFTPTITPTGPTETFTPTVVPFLYDLRDGQVIYTANTFNSAGCAWEGIGGQVFKFDGTEQDGASGLQVHVFGGAVDNRVPVGSNTIYGLSGWELKVDDKINNVTYFVELESSVGTVISPRIQIDFPSDCQRNVAIIRFIKTRP